MNSIKPYLFWIVCGVVILVELVLLVAVTPASSDGSKSPVEVAGELDAANQKLNKLYAKAKAGSPAGEVFDPEQPESINKLLDKWMPTDAWKPVLVSQLAQYAQQQQGIHEFLVKRSQSLHEPVSSQTTKADWYWDYEAKTAELLQRLYEADCLVMPATQAAPGPGPGAGPAGGATEAPAATEPVAPDFKKNSAVRSIAGFLTTITPPEPDEFPELTTKFRVMEVVAKALIDSKAVNEKSPIAPGKEPMEAPARLDKGTSLEMADDTIKVALNLQGPVSSLLAALAGLEENRADGQPIRVVTGVSLLRKTFAEGERRDITSEPAVLRLTLVVLDLSKLPPPAAAAPAAAPPPPAKPAPAAKPAAPEAE